METEVAIQIIRSLGFPGLCVLAVSWVALKVGYRLVDTCIKPWVAEMIAASQDVRRQGAENAKNLAAVTQAIPMVCRFPVSGNGEG